MDGTLENVVLCGTSIVMTLLEYFFLVVCTNVELSHLIWEFMEELRKTWLTITISSFGQFYHSRVEVLQNCLANSKSNAFKSTNHNFMLS